MTIDKILSFSPRNFCFAEADAAAVADAGGETALSQDEADAALLVENEDKDTPSPQEDELEEAEFDGKKIRITKGYKEHLLREADYRHKTHELGESRKALEAQQRSLTERANVQSQLFKEVGEYQSLQAELAKYDAYTPDQWAEAESADPTATRAAERRHAWLMRQVPRLGQELQQKASALQAEDSKRQQDFEAQQEQIIKTKIKDWSPEKNKALREFAASYGIEPAQVPMVAGAMQILDELMTLKGNIAKAREKAAKARAEAEATVVTPVTRVNAGGSPATNKPSQALLKSNPDAFDKALAKMLRPH